MTTVKVPVTASTGKGEERQEKTVEFDCPRFDAHLENLLAFYHGDAKRLYLDWFEGVFKIEHQAKVRRLIEAENGAKPRSKKDAGVLAKLGI